MFKFRLLLALVGLCLACLGFAQSTNEYNPAPPPGSLPSVTTATQSGPIYIFGMNLQVVAVIQPTQNILSLSPVVTVSPFARLGRNVVYLPSRFAWRFGFGSESLFVRYLSYLSLATNARDGNGKQP